MRRGRARRRRLGRRGEMESFAGELSFMAASAGKAFLLLMEPHRLMFLGLGCMMGLVLGIIPGIGGLTGTAMLLPFTFNMDPYSAFALLLGLGATTATGDPIPAILFGVPGGAASAATVLDGFPMAKKGEAGRALSAAYMSSLMGGVFGALLMAISIPILRPVMLFLGSPELLAFSVLGISMVAVLSGNAPLRGMTAGCIGVMIAMVGTDPQSGTLRWTFNSLYLWDGLPLTPLLLGVFALPELCDLLISRAAIAADTSVGNIYKGQWQGVVGGAGQHSRRRHVLCVQPAIRQAVGVAFQPDPAGGAGRRLYRRVRGDAAMGRPLLAARLRHARLDHEAVQVAAPPAHSRRRAGRHHRALSIHLGRALRDQLVCPPRGGHSLHHRHHRTGSAVPAGHPHPRRRQEDGDQLPGADLPPGAAVHDVRDRSPGSGA